MKKRLLIGAICTSLLGCAELSSLTKTLSPPTFSDKDFEGDWYCETFYDIDRGWTMQSKEHINVYPNNKLVSKGVMIFKEPMHGVDFTYEYSFTGKQYIRGWDMITTQDVGSFKVKRVFDAQVKKFLQENKDFVEPEKVNFELMKSIGEQAGNKMVTEIELVTESEIISRSRNAYSVCRRK